VRVSRWTLFWIGVIGVLLVVELTELTHVFTIPISSAVLSPLPFVFSLVFITLLALVGAVFVGFYLSSQVYSARGFTPFEQEMLKMRRDVAEVREDVSRLRSEIFPGRVPAGERRASPRVVNGDPASLPEGGAPPAEVEEGP
jgi:membrane protein implicated in regulation of membrane protease activity